MKLISQFKNKYNNITYKTYQTENGMKVLHLENPATSNFDFAIIHQAGSVYETLENVPKGTAHFLEHMLLNPNGTFKNKDEINKFEQGSIKRPTININAFTNRKYITFTGNGNEKGKMRIMERLESIYQFPKKKFFDQLEKERGIILAEKSRKLKKINDSYLMSLDFLFKGIQNEFTEDVLGEVVDIKKISIENLETFFHNRISLNSTAMSIQSKEELSSSICNKIEEISKKIDTKKNEQFRKIELKNKLRVGTFTDKRANGISISFIFFEEEKNKIDYAEHDKQIICARLLEWLTFEILREKQSLIYAFSPFRSNSLSFNYNIYGYKFTTEKEKIKRALTEYYKILYTTSFEFLKSKKGKEWFEDVISTYIFPKTSIYDETLGESIAPRVLENKDLFNYNLAVKEAKKIKICDIEQYLKKQLKVPPHIWIESDMSKKEMVDIIKSSPFEKKFKEK